jgi:hypothetical protein
MIVLQILKCLTTISEGDTHKTRRKLSLPWDIITMHVLSDGTIEVTYRNANKDSDPSKL